MRGRCVHSVKVFQKNADIRSLKSTINGLVNLAEGGNKRTKAEAQDMQREDDIVHSTRASKLKDNISNLRKKLMEAVKDNQENEHKMRKVSLMTGVCFMCSRSFHERKLVFLYQQPPPPTFFLLTKMLYLK